MKKTLLMIVTTLAFAACGAGPDEEGAGGAQSILEGGCPGPAETCELVCVDGDCAYQTFSEGTVYLDDTCVVDADCPGAAPCMSTYCVSGTCVTVTAPMGTKCPTGLCGADAVCAQILTSCVGAEDGALCDVTDGIAGVCSAGSCCPSCSGHPDGYSCAFGIGEPSGSCSGGLCCLVGVGCQQNFCN